MKDKLKILIGVGLVVGQILSPIGVVSAAGTDFNSILVPKNEYGPELYIKQIDPENQKVSLYYEDRGSIFGEMTNINIFWPRKVEDLRAEWNYDENFEFDFDEMAMSVGRANQWWTEVHYNFNTIKLLDAQEVEFPAMWSEYYQLTNNPYNILYFTLEMTDAGERSYWVGKADYSDCMRYYQPGVVCKGMMQEDSSIKYLPFLNGEAIKTADDNGDDNGGNDDNGDNNGSESESGTNTDGSEDESGTNEATPVNSLTNVPVATSSATSTQPVLLAGMGSAVIDSGSVEHEEIDEVDTTDAENMVNTNNLEVGTTTTTGEMEVPELGGDNKQDNYWPLVLGALAVAAGALMLWWWVLLPLIKRKKEENEVQE